MSKSTKIILGIVILGIIGFIASNNKWQSNHPDTVILGGLLPLTGDAASWGEGLKQGLEIAVEEANTTNLIPNKKVELEIDDDKCDGQEGVTALQRMILKKPNAIVGNGCSSVALAILPLTEEKKLIVTSGATSPKLSKMGEYFFRVYPSADYPIRLLGEHAVNVVGIKRFAILTINNEYGDGLRESFTNTIKQQGGIITSSEQFEVDANDVRTQLQKIRNTNPDGLFIGSNPKEFPLLIKQINEAGITIPLFADGTYIESEEGKTVWSQINRIHYVFPTPSTTNTWKRLQETYRQKYNKEADYVTQIGYDSAKVVLDAIAYVGSDSDKIKEYLLTLNNYEAAGGVFNFDQNGDVITPFLIKELKKGVVRETIIGE